MPLPHGVARIVGEGGGPGIYSYITISGSRRFPALDKAEKALAAIPMHYGFVVGCARGVDDTAWEVATRFNRQRVRFYADWDGCGKRAGMLRNEAMVEAGQQLIAFWDGVSRGTLNAINTALMRNKPVLIVRPDMTAIESPPTYREERFCPDCSGSGRGEIENEKRGACTTCSGQGKVLIPVPCRICYGGESKDNCPVCQGSGSMNHIGVKQ